MKILDACCGTRMFWLQKHNADVTYIDIRPEVSPDIVMDCRYTSFPDSTFDLIFFDPPHRKFGLSSIMAHKYGSILLSEARSLVRDAFVEFDRILKPGGLVWFKWSGSEIQDMAKVQDRFIPLMGQNLNKLRNLKSKGITGSHPAQWLIMARNPNVGKQKELSSRD